MTEEKLKQYIKGQRAEGTTENPFKVPEGYFDTLCSRVMAQLPEEQAKQVPMHKEAQKAVKRTLIPRVWKYAAVVAVGAIVSLSVLIPNLSQKENPQLASSEELGQAEQEYYDEQYAFDALEYAMVDNNEIALYLTEY